MPDHGYFFHGGLHALGHFDNSLKRRITGHHSFEEIAEDSLNLAIDQVIDVKFVETVCPFELPRPRPADDDLRLEPFDDWMGNYLKELGRVNGNQVFAGDLRINVGRIRNSQRIVGMNGYDFGLGADEFLEILEIADDHFLFRIIPQQQGLDHSQSIRHILGTPVRP